MKADWLREAESAFHEDGNSQRALTLSAVLSGFTPRQMPLPSGAKLKHTHARVVGQAPVSTLRAG
jgi:hypothetical protein